MAFLNIPIKYFSHYQDNNSKKLKNSPDSQSRMLIKKILRNNSLILTSLWAFATGATGQRLFNITKNLVNIDSIKLDQICQETLAMYMKPSNNKNVKEKEKQKQKQKKEDKNYGKGTGQEISEQNNIKNDIIYLYNVMSEAKLGYLKGDIHSQLIFKLNKMLSQKSQKSLQQQLTEKELKRLFSSITLLKQFRLPKKGIANSSLQDKTNLYQRQLALEIVSNQLSTQRYDNILDSLVKLDKIYLTKAFRRYIVEWFTPLCRAIVEQQNRCKQQLHLNTKRKIYAKDFIKLEPEKLTLMCISELLKQITSILYKDYIRDSNQDKNQQQRQAELDQYDSIRYRTLCMSLAKWVNAQEYYQKQQKKFKQTMKIYDQLFLSYKTQKQELRKKQKANNTQPELQIGLNPSQKQILEQVQKQIRAEALALNENFKAQLKLIQIQNHNQKYVAPQDRNQFLKDLMNKALKQSLRAQSDMSEEAQFQIGTILIYLMKQIIKVQNKSGFKVPLLKFQNYYSRKGNEYISEKRICVNQHFLNSILPIIEKDQDPFLHLDRSVPTIIKPMPWLQYQIGGYYQYPSVFMRFSECKVQERLIKYSDLSRVFNVINGLAQTPWKINKRVLEVIQAIWLQGGQTGQVPKRYSQMISTYITKLYEEKNYKQKKALQRKIQKLRDEHSLRSDFTLKLQIARSYGKLDQFFYPHNVDFRGRVYPIPPHLNHIGNDLSRGLLMFSEGKRLGPSGVKWLKIHCANLMGKDKATIPQKLEFIQANLGLIHAIAEDPLKNRQWLSNQDCWQSLGAIFQLSTVLKQKNPQQYVSCLHIHQDGSCNGLQHYAALGRDTEGAYQVNLGPTQRPGDVYTYVANMVIKMVQQDIANPQSSEHALANKLRGQIKRKTVKQTVMTSVYGVTFIGARQQIYRQICDQNFLKNEDEEYAASIYLAKLTLKAISNLFSSAHLIKAWLISCAKVVTDVGNPMGWITPMGLPVVQPYRTLSKTQNVNTIIHKLKLARATQNLPVNKSKQKSAFPPNYVHSLDSTHMMYTAQKCFQRGITFAAVHDSYWTHAATVDQMNTILREQFIRLHSEPLLENLKKSLQARYPNLNFPDIPQRGNFDLQKIKESAYFFS